MKVKREELVSAEAPRGEGLQGYVAELQVGFLLRRAYQRHLAIFQEGVDEFGITSVQFAALFRLVRSGPMSQGDLVSSTSIDQATIRGVLDRLSSRGLIQLGRDAGDKRKVVISATKAGNTLVQKMIPRAHAITEQTLSVLNPAERVAVVYLLTKLAGDAD